MEIAILVFPGFTALDAVGPYEVLCRLPGATTAFVAESRHGSHRRRNAALVRGLRDERHHRPRSSRCS